MSRAMSLIRPEDDFLLVDTIYNGPSFKAKQEALSSLLDRLISRELTMLALEGVIVHTEDD